MGTFVGPAYGSAGASPQLIELYSDRLVDQVIVSLLRFVSPL